MIQSPTWASRSGSVTPSSRAASCRAVSESNLRSPAFDLRGSLAADNAFRRGEDAGDSSLQGMLFRTRGLLVHQRTQTINALRGHFAKFGVLAP